MSLDRREMAYDPFQGSFSERTMSGQVYGDGDRVRCHYEVCNVCDGRGSHVNPSIDSHGLSADDFAEDPDFADNYWRGNYDVPCYQCGGSRVIPIPDDDDPNKAAYDEAVEGHYESMREYEAERRVGA